MKKLLIINMISIFRVVYNLLNNHTLKVIRNDNGTETQMTLSATTNATDPFTISSGR